MSFWFIVNFEQFTPYFGISIAEVEQVNAGGEYNFSKSHLFCI